MGFLCLFNAVVTIFTNRWNLTRRKWRIAVQIVFNLQFIAMSDFFCNCLTVISLCFPLWYQLMLLYIINSDCIGEEAWHNGRMCFTYISGGEWIPSVLWHCWLGGRKDIWPVNIWVVGCSHGYLSGVRCRLAYGPADAIATHCLLLQ